MQNNPDMVCKGLDVIRFKIVRCAKDWKNEEGYFSPVMCHQVFGDGENIYGYKNLKIQIFYDAIEFSCLVLSTFDYKTEPDVLSGLTADNFMEQLKPWLPKDFITDEKIFNKKMLSCRKTPKEPFGELVKCFTLMNSTEYEVRLASSETPGYADLHERLESLIVWYIDAANRIEISDKKWRFYILYEKVTKNNRIQYYPLGYSTVYEYYAFPDHRRYRISQFIILPPYQQVGLGADLLTAIYENLQSLPQILDITVEDPCARFQYLRDYVDSKLCRRLGVFNECVLRGDFNKKLIKEVRDQLKFNEKQIRRIFEIAKLQIVTGKEYAQFQKMIMHRLNIPGRRPRNGAKRLRLSDCTINGNQSSEHSSEINKIDEDFESLIKEYRHVLRRLEKDGLSSQ